MKTDMQKVVAGFSAVADSVYGPEYRHPPESHAFFDTVLRTALSQVAGPPPVRVLEIGCGNGYWLRAVAQTAAEGGLAVNLHGTDVTPGLIDLAKAALKDLVPAPALSVADVLKGDMAGGYSLCYAYDVVQQIDRRDHGLLFSRVRSLLEEKGVFIVFDRDPCSRYGVAMAVRKALTRRLGLRLVPDFYLLARYPSFGRLARLARRSGFEVVRDLRGASRRALVLKAR
ncbi:MAG: class I SAM-dependent methyltransferase [Candidatus Latescibacteria bacterium]|nr:class I SAM-dependent methyltransferase [Candidatus Latescibacterota bacterium]